MASPGHGISNRCVCHVCTSPVHFHRLGKHFQHPAITMSPQLSSLLLPRAPVRFTYREEPASVASVAVRCHLSARSSTGVLSSMGGGSALQGLSTAHAPPRSSCRELRYGCIRLPCQTSVVTLISPGRATAAILEIS